MTVIAAWIVLLLGLTVAGLCLWALADPRRLLVLIEPWFDHAYIVWVAAGTRLALGAALLLAADVSAVPTAFTVIGWLAIVAAIVLPFLGAARMKGMLERFEALPNAALRIWLVFAVAFGILLVYGALPALTV